MIDRKKKRPITADWGIAREMRIAGKSLREIADAIGVRHDTVRARASKDCWPNPHPQPHSKHPQPCPQPTEIPQVPHILPQVHQVGADLSAAAKKAVNRVIRAMEETAEQHVTKIKRIVPKAIDELDRRLSEDAAGMESKELLQVVQALDIGDKIGRRTHGLDVGDGRFPAGMRQTINISFSPTAEQVQESRTEPIDV